MIFKSSIRIDRTIARLARILSVKDALIFQ